MSPLPTQVPCTTAGGIFQPFGVFCEAACPSFLAADFSGDGNVGFADLTSLLNAFGPCGL